MKPAHAASRRFLPGSPFNVVPVDLPIEQFTVRDQVTHDKFGLGQVVMVEDDEAFVVRDAKSGEDITTVVLKQIIAERVHHG